MDENADIPDNDPAGITSALSLTGTEVIRHLAVELDITHTFIRDLEVELVAPTGQRVMLHDRTGGDADNVIETYDSDNHTISALLGLPVGGTWELEVRDLEGQDLGKLNRWSITAGI